MSCSAFLEKMSRHLDSALSSGEYTSLQEHLGHCQACTKRWEILRELHTSFSNAAPLLPSKDFVSKVSLRLSDRLIEQGKPAGIGRWSALALIGLGLCALMGFYVFLAPLSGPFGGDGLMTTLVEGLTLALTLGDLMWRASSVVWSNLNSVANQMIITGISLMGLLLTVAWARIVMKLTIAPAEGALDGIS